MPAQDINALYAEIRKRMIETGEWNQIRAVLAAKLSETGWTDDLKHKSKESARHMDPLSFQALLDEASPRAYTSLPLAVKREITSLIRQILERQFE
ncbi:transcription factor e(y)2-domain-containing protein [Crepidotus variabilis]|uniref:Transcription and mRNA export factor SUS1 n=1 Tax=Crepidotus variabilis TaxID=179855 RepID=A0A9P6EGK1_9AGAR|nr:transcription factor e(y)2-domain-containing protein [Crepidotus variabilis]